MRGGDVHVIGAGTDPAIAAIVRAVPDVIYRLDGRGDIVYISDAIRRYGYEPDELLGRNIFELIHPDDRDKATYKVNERRSGERGTRLLEVRLMTKDHEAVDFELSADAWPTFLVNAEGIYDPDGGGGDGDSFLYTQGVARDISERERAAADGRAAALRDEVARREQVQRELRFIQFAVDRAGDAILWFGADGRIIYVNDEACDLLGYQRGELLDSNVSAVGCALSRAGQWPELWGQIRDSPEAVTAEADWLAKGGRSIPVEVTASFFACDGRQYVCCHVRDIAQRKREEARRDARQRVREEVWGMRSVDDIFKVIQVVRQCLVDLGVPVFGCSIHFVSEGEDGVSVRSWRSALGDDTWVHFQNEVAAQRIAKMWASGQPAYRRNLEGPEFDHVRRMFSREIRSVLDVPFSHGTLAVNNERRDAFAEGDIAQIQALAEVLSEGFRRLEDLQGLEARTRDAEALAADLRKALDRESVMGRIRDQIVTMRAIRDLPSVDFWVEQLRAMGIPAQGISLQFPGVEEETFCIYYVDAGGYSEDMPLAQAPWVAEVWERGKAVQVDRRRMGEAGLKDWRISYILEVPLPGMEGSLAVNTGEDQPFAGEDIRTIELLAGLVAEGLQRIRDFEALAEREEQLRQAQKMEAVGELAAGIAHNFNNMLQGIVGNVHLAQLESGDSLEVYLGPAQETAMRAAEMVRQLMLFARKGLAPVQVPLDLSAQLHEPVQIARQTFDRRIRIVEDPAGGIVVRADGGQLQQVLMDLLLNARDALGGRDNPEIRVRWSRAGGEALIEVEDNGVGMDEYTRERIFEPFFTTKPVDQGTGLGLSTVYGIVQQHDGRIECRSVEGRGTTFAIYLPLERAGQVAAGDEPVVAAASAVGAATILVVDDEEIVRESTRKILERGGYRVLVSEGDDAVAVACGTAVDLVLLDLSMPVVSGQEVLAALRREGVAAPVVFFTGYLAEAGEHAGVAGVLQKPFTADELLILVGRMLNS